jgi:hypothetical protein
VRGHASSPDGFALPPSPEIPVYNGSWGANSGFTDTAGKTVRNLTINTGVANLILIIAGQSNAESESPTPYTPTNGSAIDNFNIYDGAVYAWADPPLGCCVNSTGSGHIGARIADKFITAGTFARVIVAPIAIGGSLVAMWDTGILGSRIGVLFNRLKARGFVSQANVTTAFLWRQGESDNGVTTQLAYTNSLNSIITKIKAIDSSVFFFIDKQTWSGGATSAAIQAAQAAVVDSVKIFAGGNTDSLNNSNRVDTTHLNDTGIAASATLDYNAMVAAGAPF